MRTSRFLDFLCLLLSACVVGLVWWDQRSSTPVLLLDRPRAETEAADFTSLFLQTTRTDYALEEGFVSLEASPSNRRRLLQLLAGLQQCLAVNAENQRRLAGREKPSLLACVPQDDGRVQVLPIGDSAMTVELLASERSALESQQQAVSDAVGRLQCRSNRLPNPIAWLFRSEEPDEEPFLEPTAPDAPVSQPAQLAATPPAESPAKPAPAPTAVQVEVKPTEPASTGAEPFTAESERLELTEIESDNPK